MSNRPDFKFSNHLFLSLALLLGLILPIPSQASTLTLANAPLQSSTNTNVLPNVMFLLDDSGSMDWDYMPDDAKNFAGKYGFNSPHCNGVYYNPDNTYLPPVDSIGKSFSDPTSTSYLNNKFTDAYVDGFSASSGTVDLDTGFTGGSGSGSSGYTSYSGHAFYYVYSGTQTAAWHMTYHNTNSTFYKECNSSIGSTTVYDGSNPVNTIFTKVTLASTETIYISVNNPTSGSATSTSVSSIKVNGIELMSAVSVASTSNNTVAANIAAKISLSGYSAVASNNVIKVTGPTSAKGYTPVITLSSGNMTFVTDQFPDTDPAKLNNFATWYTYYSTRMMMMKTGVGLAFSPIGSTYRVGFMTMNNNVAPDFVDIAPFTASQKASWYAKLYVSNPGSSTPLREALSHVGQLYAHKFGATTVYQSTITVSGNSSTSVSSVQVAGNELMAGPTSASSNSSTVAKNIATQINNSNTPWGATYSGSKVILTAPDSSTSGSAPSITSSGGMTITSTSISPVTVTATLNGVSPADPIQYSCQQNFVILSTDGYWNGPTDYDLNNNLVGNQDGSAPRPMYDGSNFNQVNTQTFQSQTQTTQSTSTLMGTLNQVLMSCNHNAATCGAAPSSGMANANWSVVGPSSTCNAGANNQCAIVNPSGTVNVTSKCNTSAKISTSGGSAATATLSFSSANSAVITAITINGVNILTSSTSSSNSTSNVAKAVVNNTGNGYSASQSGSSVTITAPVGTDITAIPLVSHTGTLVFTATYTSASAPTSYSVSSTADSNGNLYSSCSYSSWSAPTFASSCSGVNQASNPNNTTVVSATQCTTSTLQTATPVASCSSGNSGSPNYIQTSCTTSTTTVTGASSCTPGNSGPPSYITTSCTIGSGGTSDTLADVAMYYYQTDLRTPALGNCNGALGSDVCTNDVFVTPQDNQLQQHMTTYTLGIGTRGNMVYTSPNYMNDTSGDFYSVKTGAKADNTQTPPICSWQGNGTTCNWPIPASNSYNNIDDLWHAAVDGRGTYYNATDPASLSSGLSNALSSITARIGTGAAAATSTLNPVAGNNFAYVASYTTVNWTGNLEARTINTITGVISETASWSVENIASDSCPAPNKVVLTNSGNSTVYNCVTSNVGSASNCLSPGVYDSIALTCSVQLTLASTGTLPPMVSSASDTRHIYMGNSGGTSLLPFTYANLTATQQSYFNAPQISALSQWATLTTTQQSLAQGANLVNYLRGQYVYDNRTTNPLSNQIFRTRLAVMGDAIDSQPSYIAAPTFSYADSGYSNFVSANLSRVGTVYIGTNDGMLHAFDGTTGVEDWAFVPKAVMPNLYKLADVNYSTQHSYYTDGSPIISDFYCTVSCPGGVTPSWRTILVGGLNAGGREYYALDITDPANPALLWEFTPAQDQDLGYSYGLPIVTKLSTGNWVVLVTSGYDNGSTSGNGSTSNSPAGSGIGYLYVLDARSGTILSKISTGVGSSSSPSGLAKISAWNSAPSSNQAGYVYGGDLLGNIWRFDINAGSIFKVATLMDAAGNVQPITTTPTLGLINGERVIFVGTGQYLQAADLSNTRVQSLYAISDTSSTSLIDPRLYTKVTGSTTPGQMVNQTITLNGNVRTGSNHPVNFSMDRGWYIDFPDTGERENVDSKLVQGTLLVPTIVPSTALCSPGGYGWLNYLDYSTGAPVPTTLYPSGATNTNVSAYYSSPVVGINILYINGNPIVEVVNSNNPTPQVNNNVAIQAGTSNFTGTRVQWRELLP